MRHYADFFTVADDYCPVMTAAEINRTPERWLDFYPHTEFEEICKTILSALSAGKKSVWITGNYGTGKSNAALVIQKLFMDDESRVERWLDDPSNGLSDRDSLKKALFDRRAEGTLVVYDFNASAVGADTGLIVRLEKGIIAALKERGMSIPVASNLATMMERVRREGANFFKTRDSIQSQLAYLDANIQNADQLSAALSNTASSSMLLDDVQTVLHRDSIYLDADVPTFRKWIQAILAANKLKSIVYLFDEFHPFIEANREQLKTFEEVSESPAVTRFFLVPVTHMEIKAYLAEGSASARKANDRFYFRKLQMPNDTAFRLAKHAMKDIPETADEWKKVKDELWYSVSPLVDKFNGDPDRERFQDILPIHPMAAFLLKHLCEQAKSNQRSFFEYLNGGADGREFHDFIHTGGPETANRQFLTVDYLWHYFIERSDLGLDNEIEKIGVFYRQTREREFANQTEDAPELRILKAVLLFCLLDKLAPGGHDRLKPTVENVEMSFRGDGTIADPVGIIEALQGKHCFSVTNGNISLFSTSTVAEEDVEKWRDKFHELLHEKVETKLNEHTRNDRRFSSGRFDIRVSDAAHTTLTNITQATRNRYSENLKQDDGSVCLWFVVAKDHEETLAIPQKIDSMLRQLHDHRILMFTFPHLSFCHANQNLWTEYIRRHAQYMAENNAAAQKQIRSALDGLEDGWIGELQKSDTVIRVFQYKNGGIEKQDIHWNQFRERITGYVRQLMPFSVDHLGHQDPHFGNSFLRAYARAGITFSASGGPIANLLNTLKDKGLSDAPGWFEQNPNHPLAAIHALFQKKFANTADRGGQLSLRTVWSELKRAPYGLRYNALSAFVLGYCLRDIPGKNYRWTNGQISGDLDIDTLAEMIETAVRDDGANQIRNEKQICRLSEEEKAFIQSVPVMFGTEPIPNATVEIVLKQIQSRVETESAKVPLWVLSEYIRLSDSPKAESMERVLANICDAVSISSKGKVEDRVNAVRQVGTIVRGDPEIVPEIAAYIRKETFLKAFDRYVEEVRPDLCELAQELGDLSHGCCRAVLNHCGETAGWLWNRADITREMEDVLCEYEIIKSAMPLLNCGEFMEYGSVYGALKTAVTETNHLPKQIIESFRPMLADFLSAMQSGGSTGDIRLALQQSSPDIQRLFFDPAKAESLTILKSKLPDVSDVAIDDSDLLNMLNGMVGGFGMDENTFLTKLRAKIEEFAKQSVVLKIKEEWKRISGTTTPDEWARKNSMPARYIFGGIPDASDLLKAIKEPGTYAAAKLAEILETLKSVRGAAVPDCQNALKADVIPLKYRQLISLASLLEYLRSSFGEQPNDWPSNPNIEDFIKSQYRCALAPQIREKINSRSAEDLKRKLLELAEENPELGLLFWEG